MLIKKFTLEIVKNILLLADLLASIRLRTINTSDVALVRLDAIGDFVIWLDSARHIKSIYPESRIVLIANSSWAELAMKIPYWDEVWSINLRKFNWDLLYRWKIMRKINMACFFIAIQPTYSRVLLSGDSVIRVTAAKKRIGSIGNLDNIKQKDRILSNRWYTQLVPASNSTQMELNRNAEFLTGMTGKVYLAELQSLPLLVDASSEFNIDKKYCVIFPGASAIGKRWPVENFLKICLVVSKNYGLQIVLCGSSDDMNICSRIATGISGAINLAGKTTLAELSAVIQNAELVVSNDTSAIHISAAVATPSVCILGGGHYGRFLPYPMEDSRKTPLAVSANMKCFGCNWRCTEIHDKKKPWPCISKIEVDAVIRKIDVILDHANKNE